MFNNARTAIVMTTSTKLDELTSATRGTNFFSELLIIQRIQSELH